MENNNKKSAPAAGALDLWIESMDSNIYGFSGLVFFRTQLPCYRVIEVPNMFSHTTFHTSSSVE